MTFRAASDSYGGTDDVATITTPPGILGGDIITVYCVRSTSSVSDISLTSPDGDVYTRLFPAPGGAQVASNVAYVVYGKVASGAVGAPSDDSSVVLTMQSQTTTATGRWTPICYVNHGVKMPDPSTIVAASTGAGTNFVLPATNPVAGSSGGDAIGFCVGSLKDSTAGLTFSSADGVVREQIAAIAAATGQNPASAVLERSYTGDAQVPSALVTSSATSNSRGMLSLLYSAGESVPFTTGISGDQAKNGGDLVTGTVTPAGGTPPYTQAWAIAEGPAGIAVIDGTTTSGNFVAPLADTTIRFQCTVTDSTPGTPLTQTDSFLVAVSGRTLLAFAPTTLATGWTTSTGGADPVAVIDELTDLTKVDELIVGTGVQRLNGATPIPEAARTVGFTTHLDAYLSEPAATATLTVKLMEGATERASRSITPTTGITRYPLAFTPAECAAFVDLASWAFEVSGVTT